MKRLSIIVLSLAGCAPASAATVTAALTMQMSVQSSCIVAALPLDFGTRGVVTRTIGVNTTISVQCTARTPYTLSLDNGLGPGATPSARYMSNGVSTITYQLFRALPDIFWTSFAATGTGAVRVFNVFGRIPAQTTPAPGVYRDTVTVTVTY
jgi:spore coat protein U-like protein